MNRGIQVTFDAADPHALASWWAETLGYTVEDGHDVITELLATGAVQESDVVRIDGRLAFPDMAAASDQSGRGGPRLYFQRVPEPKVGKNRVHLDVPIRIEELDAEVERLVARGGNLVELRTHQGMRWAIMQDPEGNEFCLH